MSVAENLHVSPEQYLEWERAAEFRSEYVNGRVYAMAGGTPAHSLIGANAIQEMGRVLRGSPCRTYTADLRVKVPASDLYTYPDLSVVCGELEYDARGRDTVVNPSVLVEVLSPSTEKFDRGGKWAHYQLLSSLRHYLLIAQDQVRVECYSRIGESSSWRMDVATRLEDVVRLEHLGVEISVAEIYYGVDFHAADAETEEPRP